MTDEKISRRQFEDVINILEDRIEELENTTIHIDYYVKMKQEIADITKRIKTLEVDNALWMKNTETIAELKNLTQKLKNDAFDKDEQIAELKEKVDEKTAEPDEVMELLGVKTSLAEESDKMLIREFLIDLEMIALKSVDIREVIKEYEARLND